jgi:hypothetical protein
MTYAILTIIKGYKFHNAIIWAIGVSCSQSIENAKYTWKEPSKSVCVAGNARMRACGKVRVCMVN